MKKEMKEKWLQALRSGEYTQGSGLLRTADDKFCCLGVLCDLVTKEDSRATWTKQTISNVFEYNTEVCSREMLMPPVSLCKAVGIDDDMPPHGTLNPTHPFSVLAKLNDDGRNTF